MYYLRIVEKSLKKDKETGKVHSVEDYVQNTCLGSWYNKIMPDDDIFSDAAKDVGENPKDLCCIIVSGQTDNYIPILDYLTFKKRYPAKKTDPCYREDTDVCSKWNEYYIVNDYGNTYERLM